MNADANGTGSNYVPSSESALPNGGQTLRKAFEALVESLNQRGSRHALIGRLATAHHMRVRATTVSEDS
jgi:hypothetical protein